MGKVSFSLPLALCGGRVHKSGQGHHMDTNCVPMRC